jgi:hypothetical protein
MLTKIVKRLLGKHPLERPRRRWENNFTLDLEKIILRIRSGCNLVMTVSNDGLW